MLKSYPKLKPKLVKCPFCKNGLFIEAIGNYEKINKTCPMCFKDIELKKEEIEKL
jgi:hypothetical protein